MSPTRRGAHARAGSQERNLSSAVNQKRLHIRGCERGVIPVAHFSAAYTAVGSANLRDLSGRSRNGKETLESLLDFPGFEPKRSGLALISDAAFTVDYVEPVRPCSVSPFRGVIEIVDDRGDPQRQLGGACSLYRATFGKSRGTRNHNLLFLVVLVLPSVNGVSFQNINYIECSLVLVPVVELVKPGNLPAKRRSGIAPENQHDRFLPTKRSKRYRRLFIGGGQVKAGSRIAHLQPAGPCQKPELLEGNNHHEGAGHVAYYFTEQNWSMHDGHEAGQEHQINKSKDRSEFAELTHRRLLPD
jgi:hypothetical protein